MTQSQKMSFILSLGNIVVSKSESFGFKYAFIANEGADCNCLDFSIEALKQSIAINAIYSFLK